MKQNKKIIGITGGSGCGKSYISGILRGRGIPVIDADKVAHEVMEAGKPCCREIIEYFGTKTADGGVDRKKLAEIVFADEKKLEMLNKITHKYILESINNRIEHESSDTVCVDGATLIESGMHCDVMVGVLADVQARRMRIIARDGISPREADARIGAQPADAFYDERCDVIIRNDGGRPNLEELMKRIEE